MKGYAATGSDEKTVDSDKVKIPKKRWRTCEREDGHKSGIGRTVTRREE